jgi:hypothetical protein
MSFRSVARLGSMVLTVMLLAGAGACKAPANPSPVLATEVFNGTLQPAGVAFHTFTINYVFSSTDLSVIVNSLSAPAGVTAIGVGFGNVSGTTCAVQISTSAATIGSELFAPNGASAGAYCVQIFDPVDPTTGLGTLTDPATYQLTVKHY